jgi:hypothetical protein
VEKMYHSVWMQKKQALKSGAILVSESGTKKQESFDMMADKYNILCKGRKIYSSLTEEEYFDVMENLAQDFYLTGSPNSKEIETEIIGD